MTALSFSERMSGHVSFDEADYNAALQDGRRRRNTCKFELRIEVDDLDRFIADPDHQAGAGGWVDCPELGGRLEVERGTWNLWVDRPDHRHRHMLYRLFLRDGEGRPLTLSAFKNLQDDPNLDIWSDTTALLTRLYAGHLEADAERADRLVATGILFIGRLDFLALVESVRVRGGSRLERVQARQRFAQLFLRGLREVYGGPVARDSQPDFPAPRPGIEPFDGQPPEQWHDLPGHPGLRRRILPLTAGDGRALTLQNVRGQSEPRRGPVLLVHGAGVRANLFYGAPTALTLVDVLVAKGYDVWLENWRASIDLPPNDWNLDKAAVFDHPVAVREVVRRTGSQTLKAVVHCQGSTSFTMAALAGLVPQVTTVVSNAVSLHVDVPLRSRVKQYCLVPAARVIIRGADPQWGVRSPSAAARLFARWARLVRRECDSPVCSLANYIYGVGPDVLWRHENLDGDTHAWVTREFGHTSDAFYRQMARCVRSRHLVPVDGLPALPDDLLGEPRTDARFAFMAGARNRCFLPVSQRRSFEHFDALRPNFHSFYELPNYTHIDVFFGRRAYRDVYPLIVDELERAA